MELLFAVGARRWRFVKSLVAVYQVRMNGGIRQVADGSASWCGSGLFDEIEYHRQKKSLEWELESLLIPEVDAAKEAGKLLADMPRLWAGANLQERHQLLTTILDAVYIDMKERKSIVSMKLKPAFQAVLEATSLDRVSGVALVAR